MTRALFAALLLLGSSALAYEQELKTVATLLNDRLEGASRRQVAVVDFTDLQGTTTELGRFLAEELSIALASQSKGFVVIDRTHLKAILQEHKLAASGIIDPQTARQLGKIAGVDALVTGTVTPFGDSVRISVKALDTQTAAMLAATTADVPKTKAVEELLARSVGIPAAPAAAASAPRSAAGGQTVSAGGLTFEFGQCRGGSPIMCEFFVLSPSADVNLEWNFPSRAVDANGNEFEPDIASSNVGNQQLRGRLVAGVRTRLTASFVDPGGRAAAPSRGATLALIELSLSTGGPRFTVQFRNVPLE